MYNVYIDNIYFFLSMQRSLSSDSINGAANSFQTNCENVSMKGPSLSTTRVTTFGMSMLAEKVSLVSS